MIKNTIRQIFSVQAALSVNTFLYYIKRLWLVGKLVPDSLYESSGLKNGLTALVQILVQLGKIVTKALYIGLMAFLPVFLAVQDPALRPAALIHVLFFLSCVAGPFESSVIFDVTRQKYLCLKYLRMDPGAYVRAALLIKYAPHYLWFLPSVLVFCLLMGTGLWQALGVWFLLIAFRLIGEGVQLWVFDKTGLILSRCNGTVWPILGIGTALAYLPLLGLGVGTAAGVIISPFFVAGALLLGGLSLGYVARYGYYKQKLPGTLDEKYLFSQQMKQQKSTATFKDVAMKEEDLEQAVQRAGAPHAEGYSYLNALFFKRHRRQLWKAVNIRVLIVAAVFLIGLVFVLLQRDLARKGLALMPNTVGFFAYIMYFMTVAQKSCRAMFYNCDISLLRYPFYRRPKVILQNFAIRLRRVARYDLTIGAAVCLMFLFLCLAAGVPLTMQMGMFFLSILLFCLFFSVHHLFLYYVFQPYTTELNIKNPFFMVINSVVYLLCFWFMKMETVGTTFMLAVLGFTLLYIVVALVLVYRFAPRTFRVK